MFCLRSIAWCCLMFVTPVAVGQVVPTDAAAAYSVRLNVTSELPAANVPMDPTIDFAALIARASACGVLDLNSIQIINRATNKPIPHTLNEEFNYGDRGRVLWLIEDPSHREFEIRFRTAAQRPPRVPQKHTPLIGVGDLLSYNAGVPRPVVLRFPSRLVDFTGDGKLDLVGALAHFYGPRSQNGGIVCYPGVGNADTFEFGDMLRVRYLEQLNDQEYQHFLGPYLMADVADLNRDGLQDILYTTTAKAARPGRRKDIHKYVSIFLNSGKRDNGGLPVFRAAGRLPLPSDRAGGYWWGPIRAVDLNQDGALDLVVGRLFAGQAAPRPDTTCFFLENTNPLGWPLQLAEPVQIDCGRQACFYDVDNDGLLDAVGMQRDPRAETPYRGDVVTWRRNEGGDPPKFGRGNRFSGLDLRYCQFVSAVETETVRGLLLGDLRNHGVVFLEHVASAAGQPTFRRRELLSDSAQVAAGDQASPYPCDWEGDGDWDFVVGGGNGWPQVIINEGSNSQPAFAKPRQILSQGRPIRVFMSQVFPGIRGYYHDMGYPFPSYIDWDADGLPDLMMPNITNRIFWYRNEGTRQRPKFGPRRQIQVDGYPETPARLAATAKLLGAGTQKWSKRMLDPNSPFGWRARAGFGDLTGDGLMDMVHADGRSRNPSGYADVYALFVQYRDAQGEMRLRRDRVITLPDGSPLKAPVAITSQALVTDWDGDGLLDLICHMGPANTKCQPMFVRNIGTRQDPRFDYPAVIACWGEPLFDLMKHGPYWAMHDFDQDGRQDLLAGGCYGNYALYRRTALEMDARPKIELGAVRALSPDHD